MRLDKVRLNRSHGYSTYRLIGEVLSASALERAYKPAYEMNAVRPQRAT